MLDDDNVLNQFYVHERVKLYGEGLDELISVSSAKLAKSSRAKINKAIIVSENSGLGARFLQLWLNQAKNNLQLPAVVVSELKRSWLDKNTLVIFDYQWLDKKRYQKLYKLACEVSQVVVPIEGSWFWSIVHLFGELKVVGQVDIKRLSQTVPSVVEWGHKCYRPGITVDKNLAKQLALFAVGKTAVFTSTLEQTLLGEQFIERLRCIARNLAFGEELFSQAERLKWGWSSHPVDKPFATFVVKYNYSNFEERLLVERSRQMSGLLPASRVIEIEASNLIEATLKADALAYYMATYLAVLNKRSLKPDRFHNS